MLIYHPAYDIYHTTFRIICILGNSMKNEIEVERVRIYDYISLFPHELCHIRLPAGNTHLKKKFPETAYNKVPSKKKVFNQLKDYFDVAAQCLISFGVIELSKYLEGKLVKTVKFEEIIAKLDINNNSIDLEIYDLFRDSLDKITLQELKNRFQ
jgi:hypothetical protein